MSLRTDSGVSLFAHSRLTRSIAKPPPPSLILPSSLVALKTGYSVKPTSNAVKSSSKWENYWVGAGVASNDREASVAQASIATRWEPVLEEEEKKKAKKDDDSTKLEVALTSAAIKVRTSTSALICLRDSRSFHS